MFLISNRCILNLPNRSLTRYVRLRVARASGMPGTFSPPSRVSDPDMHHGTCVTHVAWCMPGSLTSGLLWSRWRGKRSRHSRHIRNPQFYVSGKRPMAHSVSLALPCITFMSVEDVGARSEAGIDNCIPQYSVGHNYLYLFLVSFSSIHSL